MHALIILFLLVSGTDKPVEKQNPPNDKNKDTQTEQAIPSRSSAPNTTIHDPSAEAHGNNDRYPSNDRIYKIKVEETPPDWWMRAYVGVTGLLAILALGTLLYVRHQRDVMKDQLQAMRDQLSEMKTAREQTASQMIAGGEQTQQLIGHASDQAEALLAAADAATIQARAAILTAEAIRDLAKAAEKTSELGEATAKAALMNAQVAANAERAWIIPRLKAVTSDHWSFELENFGRTPAEIIGIQSRDLFLGKLDDLPDEPNYGPKTGFVQMRLLCSGETWAYEGTSTSVVPQDLWPELKASGKRWVIIYAVQYRSIVSNTLHESRVCYFWSPMLSNFIPAGPPDYTTYT